MSRTCPQCDLREEMVKLVRGKPRYGSRRLHGLLGRRGHEVNVKRVYRLYVEEGLMVRRKRRKRLVRECAVKPCLTGTNKECGMDFIVDGLAIGRRVLQEFKLALEGREAMAPLPSQTTTSNITKKLQLGTEEKSGAGQMLAVVSVTGRLIVRTPQAYQRVKDFLGRVGAGANAKHGEITYS